MKVTLITGTSSGIGEALANKLAERKHNLLLVARSSDKLSIQCKQLSEKFGITVHFIAADLSKPDAPETIFAKAKEMDLVVEMLINNAGIGSGGEFTELALKSELDMMQLNNSAMVALTHLFLPAMQKQKQGTIINVASMAAFMPAPYMSVYAATKVFVRSFTEAITEECKPYNIHVMLFCPGLTKTNFNSAAGIDNEKGKALTEGAALQTPEQVADEALKALDQKKHKAISGAKNRLAASIMTFIPNAFLAKNIATTYRKKMGMNFNNHQKSTIIKTLTFFSVLFFMQLLSSNVFAQNTIQTNSGLVRGVLEDGIEKFKGIPYAAPPVGENRFHAPKSPIPWSGIFEANKEGASAPQYIDKLGKLQLDKIVGTGWDKGDNFLTLNIWKPIEAKKLPVMVWIHGGAFTLGKKNADAYDGTNFAKSGVICVNINYRLGIEGFVNIPGGTTNNGVRDMLFALNWVKQNITAFGGDPNNVTIFGESAGGTAVSVLVASPLSKGLFQKAIAQSGSVYNIRSLESSKKLTDKLVEILKIEPTLNGFRSKTFEENLIAQRKIDIGTIFITYGDDVLPESPMELLEKGAGKDINFLITTCEDEANIFTVPKKLLWLPGFVAKRTLARTMSKAEVNQIYNDYDTEGGSGGRVLTKILTDINFRSPSRIYAASHQGQTHFMEFDWKSNAINGKLGAAHAIDIPFVFSTTAIVQGKNEILGTNDALKEGRYFHKMWVDFAKTGVLNWEEYTIENKNVFYQSQRSAQKEIDLKATKYLIAEEKN